MSAINLFELLSPDGLAGFRRDLLGREFKLVHADENDLEDLFNWDDLNRILATERLDPNRLKLLRKGRVTAFPLFAQRVPQIVANGNPRRLDPERVQERLAAGDTLVIDAIEELHLPLRTFVEGIERSLGSFVQVNAYISAGTTEGLDIHWDDHEVFVLQVAGRKHWTILGPSLVHPVRDLADPPRPPDVTPARFDEQLLKGDVLYNPRGWWHGVRAVGEPTIHLAVSIRVPQAIDFIQTMLRAAVKHTPILRDDLPLGAPQQQLETWIGELRCALDQVFSIEALAGVETWSDTPPARPSFALPASLDRDESWEEVAHRRAVLCHGEIEPVIHASLEALRGPSRAAIDELLTGHSIEIGAVIAQVDAPGRSTLAAALRAGAIELLG